MLESVVFWVLAVVAVPSGVAVFVSTRWPGRPTRWRCPSSPSGLVLLLFELDYLGVITVLMMVMEMAIMAVYMVMFMG